MKVYNTDTKKVETLIYSFNGCDCLADVHGNSNHGNSWNKENECWEMSQADIDWWKTYIEGSERADAKAEELLGEGKFSFEQITAIQADSLSGEMEDEPTERMSALLELESSK